MTVTTAETLSVNGTILNTLAYNIESITGRWKVPDLRTANISIPGRNGTLRTTRKFYDEATMVLPMWVRGGDEDGNIPGDSTARREFQANIKTLTKLFRPGSGMLEVLYTQADETVMRAMAECTDAIDFSMVGNSGDNPLAKFSVALCMPEPFWEDVSISSIDLPIAQNGEVSQLAGTTAPIEDAVFTITGPATNPKCEALIAGAPLENPTWFLYSGTVGVGQTLVVDCENWALSGTGGFTPNYANFSHMGGARWFTFVPGLVDAAPGLRITASSTSGATRLNVQARRKFLVG